MLSAFLARLEKKAFCPMGTFAKKIDVMRTLSFLLLLLSVSLGSFAQVVVKGMVTDKKGEPLTGANVFIKGSYDGTAVNHNGSFALSTSAKGKQVLVATFIGYVTQEVDVDLATPSLYIVFKLKEEVNELNGVVITAGTFETADRKRNVTLQPLDIVTTPSATGDIYGALTTLPGAATIGEDGRLFVRGGDGYESKTFIDGLLSKKPYSSNVPDLPSRGRFSPFLFTGTTFSTGGYSAEYGQALSSALILTTNAFPEKTQTDISIMTIGGGVNQTLKGERSSLSLGVDYSNLGPYFQLFPQKFAMNKYPESLGATLSYRQKVSDEGVLKLFGTFSSSQMGLRYPSRSDAGVMDDVSINNANGYANVSYSDKVLGNWLVKAGAALTVDNNDLDMQSFTVYESLRNLQAKVTLKRSFSGKFSLLFGSDATVNDFKQNYTERESGFSNRASHTDFTPSAYAEAEFKPYSKLAVRTGVRSEYSSLLSKGNVALRLSAAYMLSTSSQVSVAYGDFYQSPEENLLRFTHQLAFERATHYIVNYQWEKSDRLLRVELYRKEYNSLVTYNSAQYWDGSLYGNSGYGHSQGVDVFFKDRKTIRAFEYWLSYSYVNSKRMYRDYPQLVTPSFAPAHTLSLVGKKWVQSITTQFGISATLSSGRKYNNPNSSEFMAEESPMYSDVSVNCSHLTTILGKSTIVYTSINNLLGRNNIYGYRYYSKPNANGVYESYPIEASSKRFFFIGVFITL